MRKTPAAAACALALAMSLAAPGVPWAYASALAYEGDAGSTVYVDEDQDGYDDNTDEWIGFGTASALAAQSDSSSGQESGTDQSGASASSGNSAATGSGSSANDDADNKTSSKDKADDKSTSDKDKDKPTSSAFTFAGTGTTVDNATSGDGVEFFTIKTGDDKVYYLVVDRNSGTDNVYLLNTVTGSDLQALAENGKINLAAPAVTAPAEEKKDETQQEQPQQQGVPEWLAYLLVVAVVGGGAFAYYRLKVKPEREESKVDESEVRSFEDDGIYPSPDFEQYGNWN